MPGGDALGDGDEVADFETFEGCTFDAGFVEQEGGVEETVEVEGAAGGEEGAHLGGALVLLVDPGEVGAGLEGEDPGATEGGEGSAGDVVAEAGPLERGGAGFMEDSGDGRQ